MARTASNFRQADVTRAVNGATKAGLQIVSVKINPQTGEIKIEIGTPRAQDSASPEGNEWDKI
jgi:hypothetical protein